MFLGNSVFVMELYVKALADLRSDGTLNDDAFYDRLDKLTMTQENDYWPTRALQKCLAANGT